LFTWLGLDASAEGVERALVEARIAVNLDPGSPQVAVGKWRGSFSESDRRTVERIAGRTLADLGYDTQDVPAPEGERRASALHSLKDRGRAVVQQLARRGFHRRALRTVTRSGELLDRALECLSSRDLERLGRT